MEPAPKTPEKRKRKSNKSPKMVYNIEEEELKKIEVDKNIYLRILRYLDDIYIDIRKFYKNFPTKQGIRFKLNVYNKIKDLLTDLNI